jgi:serine/threonine protein kinase
MIHRDIKPANVFLRFRNVDHRGDREFKFDATIHRDSKKFPIATAVVLDFGIADVPWRSESVYAFTPGYAAPEQLARQPCSYATDVYALAATVCHMLTGAPFFADSDSPHYVALVEPPIDARVRGILAGKKRLLRLLDDATDLRPGARIDPDDFGAAFQAL